MRFPCGMHFSEGYICRKRQKRLLQRTRITAARNNSTKHCISLRWHYPNQVMGQSNTAYSQPTFRKHPVFTVLLYNTMFWFTTAIFFPIAFKKDHFCIFFNMIFHFYLKNRQKFDFNAINLQEPIDETSKYDRILKLSGIYYGG